MGLGRKQCRRATAKNGVNPGAISGLLQVGEPDVKITAYNIDSLNTRPVFQTPVPEEHQIIFTNYTYAHRSMV